jgi:hypothetical protein
VLAGGTAILVAAIGVSAAGASLLAAPKLVRDVRTGSDQLGSLTSPAPDPIQDYVQPDTEIEPSISVNPGTHRTS